jgi:hypothetical protein
MVNAKHRPLVDAIPGKLLILHMYKPKIIIFLINTSKRKAFQPVHNLRMFTGTMVTQY